MNEQTDSQLLRLYARKHSEAAFSELVHRHLDFVYSAALRMVCDPHLAEDVTQGVFLALAKSAGQLAEGLVLSSWLHRTARNIAAQTVRTIERRRAREQEAVVMNQLLATESDAPWEHIAPHLDAALGELTDPDRDAVLLRYFERKSAREMAQILGTSEDAAQRRVSRAVERLREFFAKRGVTVGASGLVVVISANAVQAAPVGLAVTISTAAALAATNIAATATATATKAIAMTTIQKTIIGATLAVAVGTGIYQAREASQLREQNQALQQQQVEQAQLLNQALAEATNQVAALRNDNERLSRNATELLRLRGEVARLKNDARTATEDQAADKATESTAKSWLERVNYLKQRLEHTPEANIPELQLLTDKDWLLAAANKLDTDTDYRRALSALRQFAKNKTSPLIKEALKKYAEANGDQFPSEASQLKPYCNPPLNDAILSRYKVIPMDYLNVGLSGKLALAEGSPVDAEYDSRSVFGPKGSMTGTPFRSFPIDKTLWPVLNDFKAANPQLNPSAPSQLLPYATKPEQQAALQQLTEALEAYKRDHNGQSPNEIPELSPYLKVAK